MRALESMTREDLIEECAWLRSEVAQQRLDGQAALFAATFNISPNQARTLMALYLADARFVSQIRLFNATVRRDGDETNDVTVLRTNICMIRRAIGKGAIECVSSFGYRLTSDGMAICNAALNADRS